MPAVTIDVSDLLLFVPDLDRAKAAVMIEGAIARAALIAPCIVEDDFAFDAAARSVLIGALARWEAAGPGVVTSETIGPYAVTREATRELFRPSELAELQNLCRASGAQKAGPVWSFPPAPRPVVG